jgi:hypothetical protein
LLKGRSAGARGQVEYEHFGLIAPGDRQGLGTF